LRLLILFYLRQLLLIIFLLLGNTFAAVENNNTNDNQITPDDIYNLFSNEENNKEDGLLALATGIPLTVVGVVAFVAYKNHNQDDEPNMAALGIPLALIGIPIIIYGIYSFIPKKKTQSAHLFITPTIDVLHPQAGIGMHVSF